MNFKKRGVVAAGGFVLGSVFYYKCSGTLSNQNKINNIVVRYYCQ